MDDLYFKRYVKSLAEDYLEYIRLMQACDDPDERRELSAQRSICHDELIRLLGSDYARPFDMQAHCRRLVNDQG